MLSPHTVRLDAELCITYIMLPKPRIGTLVFVLEIQSMQVRESELAQGLTADGQQG